MTYLRCMLVLAGGIAGILLPGPTWGQDPWEGNLGALSGVGLEHFVHHSLPGPLEEPKPADPPDPSPHSLVYAGTHGVFHLTVRGDTTLARGIFWMGSWHDPTVYTNTFRYRPVDDPRFWHYEMVGFNYEVALEKEPAKCIAYHGHPIHIYRVYVRAPKKSREWHLLMPALKKVPVGNEAG
jgi:hypothetical protein